MYMCVCMYVRTHTHIHIYTHTYILLWFILLNECECCSLALVSICIYTSDECILFFSFWPIHCCLFFCGGEDVWKNKCYTLREVAGATVKGADCDVTWKPNSSAVLVSRQALQWKFVLVGVGYSHLFGCETAEGVKFIKHIRLMASFRNIWSPASCYVFMTWCLMKHRTPSSLYFVYSLLECFITRNNKCFWAEKFSIFMSTKAVTL